MANYIASDTDLTSIANAIRTKGGTSAQLAFPEDFVSAIAAISGGGGGSIPGIANAAAGFITVDADITTPANTGTKIFPGLDLDFKPDFLWISMTKATWESIKETASNNHIYWLAAVNADLAPVIRFGNTSSSQDRETVFFYAGPTVWSTTSNADGGHGVGAPVNVANSLWALNADGTLSYSRNGTGSNAQTAIYAGQYVYFAIKLAEEETT